MSILPLEPQQPSEPESPQDNETQIIRRWLWRQFGGFVKAVVFVVLGMGLGVILTSRALAPDSNSAFIAQMGGNAARLSACEAALHVIKQEQARFATVLLEPNQGNEFVMGALALLLGAPAGAGQILSGLTPPQPKWVLRGKLMPMSSVPNAQYSWVNLETRQSEGPFKPDPPK